MMKTATSCDYFHDQFIYCLFFRLLTHFHTHFNIFLDTKVTEPQSKTRIIQFTIISGAEKQETLASEKL